MVSSKIIAVAFARWLDVKFEIWCDMQIEKLMHAKLFPKTATSPFVTSKEKLLLRTAIEKHCAKVTSHSYSGHKLICNGIVLGFILNKQKQVKQSLDCLDFIFTKFQKNHKLAKNHK